MHEYKERPGACAACGNSPVNHTLTYILQSTDVVLGRIAYRVARANAVPAWFARLWSMFTDALSRSFYIVSEWLHIIRYDEDPTKARSYRSQVIWEEAIRRGIDMEQAIIWGRATDTYRARLGGGWQYFNSIPVPPQCSLASTWWMDDKYLLKEHLRPHGIALPKSASVKTAEEARAAYEAIGGRVIVKPQSGSRGRHTTTHVRNVDELTRAVKSAKQLCARVCVEEHLEGPVCRATVVGGKLAGFFEGRSPYVMGDGVHTIAELVAQKNAGRHERVQEIILTPEHDAFLARQGYTRNSIVPKGKIVELIHRTGRLFGGETRELLSSVHPILRAELERAANLLDTPVVGFDLIIADPEADPRTQRWGIIEANSLPFIDLHYLPLYGTPSNPAAAVWDLWERKDLQNS